MSLPPPPPPKPDTNNHLSATPFSFPITSTNNNNNNNNDEPLSPLSQTFTNKPLPQPLVYPKPSTNNTITTQTINWNDPPLSWTPISSTGTIRPVTSRSSSSTALDINALYATANPRVTPRRRLSSMINTKAYTSVSAPTTPMTATIPLAHSQSHQGLAPGATAAAAAAGSSPSPPPYLDDAEWRDVKGNVERGERGSVSGSSGGYGYAYGDEERSKRRARRRRTIKGVAVLLVLVTLGLLGVLVRGGPFTSGLSSFEFFSGNDYGHGNGEGGEMSEMFWGFNVSGMPTGGFIEKCKAMAWRPKVPEFLAKYFSEGEEDVEVEDDEGVEVQTITRTIRLKSGDLRGQRPMTVSRIMRGRSPVKIDHVDDDTDDEETEFGDGEEQWEKQHQELQKDGGESTEADDPEYSQHRLDHDPTDEAEEEAHRAILAEMWAKHDAPVDAPVAPVSDNEHGGNQAVFAGSDL